MLSLCALGTQAPLGAGFGNPFASAVGTSLGSSTLGGTTSPFLRSITPYMLPMFHALYHMPIPSHALPFCLNSWFIQLVAGSVSVSENVVQLYLNACDRGQVRSHHKNTALLKFAPNLLCLKKKTTTVF